MADPRYDMYFRGEILAGADETSVKAAVAKIFKADAAKLAILFSGKVNTIKKAVDKPTAAKYQQAFKKAGAKLVITLAKVEQEKVSANLAKAKTTIVSGDVWDVLPPGSDLLKPDERRNMPDADIDTSGIKVVSPFAEIEIAEKAVPLAPNTSHITVADVGEDMNPERPKPAADLELDLSAFTVAEAGTELMDKKEKIVPSAPDTDHIKLV